MTEAAEFDIEIGVMPEMWRPSDPQGFAKEHMLAACQDLYFSLTDGHEDRYAALMLEEQFPHSIYSQWMADNALKSWSFNPRRTSIVFSDATEAALFVMRFK